MIGFPWYICDSAVKVLNCRFLLPGLSQVRIIAVFGDLLSRKFMKAFDGFLAQVLVLNYKISAISSLLGLDLLNI